MTTAIEKADRDRGLAIAHIAATLLSNTGFGYHAVKEVVGEYGHEAVEAAERLYHLAIGGNR